MSRLKSIIRNNCNSAYVVTRTFSLGALLEYIILNETETLLSTMSVAVIVGNSW